VTAGSVPGGGADDRCFVLPLAITDCHKCDRLSVRRHSPLTGTNCGKKCKAAGTAYVSA
jgi:hypothetical protein